MKQVVQNYRTGELKVEEVPVPALHSGGLLVANRYSVISAGTEKSSVGIARKNLAGKAMERPDLVRKVLDRVKKDGLADTMKMVFARLDTPGALGYSCAGIVLDVGGGVEGFSVGDRVACAGQNYASHAEVVYVPKNLCVKIPDGVDWEQAAFVTLGAIALQGVRQAEPRLGERVAVIGLGLLGQLTVQMLKANGCLVLASDIDPAKLDLAKKYGADELATADFLIERAAAFTRGKGIDLVIVTASTKDNGPVEVAGEIARKKGRVVVVGAVGMSIPREPYYVKELELRLSTSYGPGRYDREYEEKGHDYPFGYVRWTENRNMEAFLDLIRQGKVNISDLITHRFPIAEAGDAYALMMENREPYLAMLLHYDIGATVTSERRIVRLGTAPRPARVNLGIIGAGNHVKDMLLSQLTAMKDVGVTAICTATGINARNLAAKVGAAYCTTDFHQLLDDSSINAVLIGTRHDSHASMVIEALKAGKHVFVEKPLCLTEDELTEIARLYHTVAVNGVQLLVGFNRRFSPHAREMQAFFAGRSDPLVMVYRVNAGAIPANHWIQDTLAGGGRILGEACHFIDYMQAISGAAPVSVHGRRIRQHSSGVVDDQSILTITFGDGSIGTVIYAAGGSTILSKERFEAFGAGKAVTMDDFTVSEFYAPGRTRKFKTGRREKGFQEEMACFVRMVLGAEEDIMPFEGIESVTRATILAARSLQTGQVYEV